MSFPPDLPFLWLDLETTGADTAKDEIIEVGAFLTNHNLDLFPGPDFQMVIKPSPQGLERIYESQVVYEMHSDSGLLDDCFDSEIHQISHVDANMAIWLTKHNVKDAILAGSGISNFDRPLIKRLMPRLELRLNRRMLDIGHVRRFLDLIGKEKDTTDAVKPHRAFADARFAWEQANHYKELLK